MVLIVLGAFIVFIILCYFFVAGLIMGLLELLSDTKRKKRAISTTRHSSKPKKIKQTQTQTPANAQNPKPENFTTSVELQHVYATDSLSLGKHYYARRDTDLKINPPVIKIYNMQHEHIGIVPLKQSANISLKFNKGEMYYVTAKQLAKNVYEFEVHFDEAAPALTQHFNFKETKVKQSAEAQQNWLRYLHSATMLAEEKAELAYLGPNWVKSEQCCTNCQSKQYEIQMKKEVPIVVNTEQKSVMKFSTCLLCETIKEEEHSWQASSEEEYANKISYLASLG